MSGANRLLWAALFGLVGFFVVAPARASALSCDAVEVERYLGKPSARELYFLALCGALGAPVLETVEQGEGKAFELPADLAEELDRATPGLARVDWVYVRGGGYDKPTIVIVLPNGYSGVLIETRADWSKTRAGVIERYWNALPYEFLRRVSIAMHDAVLTAGDKLELGLSSPFGFVKIVPLRGALASPFGHVFFSEDAIDEVGSRMWSGGHVYGPGMLIHELGHELQFQESGLLGTFAFVDEFSSISWRNCWVLLPSLKVPFCIKKRAGESDAAFVSHYAGHGEMKQLEDYADTLTVAIGSTQQARLLPDWKKYPTVSFTELFNATNPSLSRKAEYFRNQLSYGLADLDADADGCLWTPGKGADDDDGNPVVLGTGCAKSSAGGACGHDACETGSALAATCSSCTASVCASDAFCCSFHWDPLCALKARALPACGCD